MVYKIVCTAILANLMTGCAKYSVAVNERTVYTPPPIFTAFSTQDANLQRCIDATIKEGRLTQPEQLKRLFCPNSEIKTLNGIEVFTEISVLDLSHNQISSAGPLSKLKHLKKVNLTGNALTKIAQVKWSASLEQLVVKGNQSLDCELTDQLKQVKEVTLPEHCTQ